MGAEQQNFDVDAASSLLTWWSEAGVDCAISETPFDWLAGTAPRSAPSTPTAPQSVPNSVKTLAELVSFLATADLPDAGPVHRRLAPAGDAAAALMILVDFPDSADLQAGELLSDPVFAKMLEAIGHSRETVYIAALSPGRPVTGRLSEDAIARLAPHALLHVALAAPERLWLVGTAASRAILGIDDASAKGKLHLVNHAGGITETIATAHPRMFEGSKARKSAAWVEMQRLISKDAE